MSEILTGRYNIRFLKETASAPVPSPFKVPATAQSILGELNLNQSGSLKKPADYRGRIKVSQTSFLAQNTFVHQCSSCRICSALSIPQLSQSYFEHCPSEEIRPRIHCLLLSDFSNVISSMMQGNPKSRERTNRLVCAHLKDIQQFPNVSFVCAALNMADLGTKMGGNFHLFRQFSVSGQLHIGFMSRGECRRALTQLKPTTSTTVADPHGREEKVVRKGYP